MSYMFIDISNPHKQSQQFNIAAEPVLQQACWGDKYFPTRNQAPIPLWHTVTLNPFIAKHMVTVSKLVTDVD